MIFDPEFYPTPESVIKKMVEPYKEQLHTATVLEPSAGSGAILDYITETGIEYVYRTPRGEEYPTSVKADIKRVYAVEHNPELQMILQQKNYALVGEDFLSFNPDILFNLILMNPPFHRGCDHLLHAWNILDHGDIACLLNAETVRNPYTAQRKLLKEIIAKNGTVEELGPCFKDADNPTDVDVVLVRLHKEAKANPFTFEVEGTTEEGPSFKEMISNGSSIEQSSRLDAYIRCWDKTRECAIAYIKAREKLRFYMGSVLDMKGKPGHLSGDHLIKAISEELNNNSYNPDVMERAYNSFIGQAKQEVWRTIFKEIGIEKYMTSGLRRSLDNFRQGQSGLGITKDNILRLVRYILSNVNVIMDNAVVEVYDRFTNYYKGNTAYKEGWKTNKQFKCNRKIVIPNMVNAGFMPSKYGYDKYYKPSWNATSDIDDIDKAMCWLSGKQFDSLTGEVDVPGMGKTTCPANRKIYDTIKTIPVGSNDWHESAFFRVKAFKKGTLHLEFKDEALWAKFNQVVNQGKNIVGDTEK